MGETETKADRAERHGERSYKRHRPTEKRQTFEWLETETDKD